VAFENSLYNIWQRPPSAASRDIFRIFGCMWFPCVLFLQLWSSERVITQHF